MRLQAVADNGANYIEITDKLKIKTRDKEDDQLATVRAGRAHI
jgi:hypothetical protein